MPHDHVHGDVHAEAFDPAALATLVVEAGLVLMLAALLWAQAAARRAL